MAPHLATGGQHEIPIAAPPTEVWSLVQNVERFGEWSPETYRAEWLTPPPIDVGSRFRGHNKRVDGLKRWWSDCVVLEFLPPEAFAFQVVCVDFQDGRGVMDLPQPMRTTWRYFVSSDGDGDGDGDGSILLVTFECPALADPDSGYRKNDRFEAIDSGARETLQRIRDAAEAA